MPCRCPGAHAGARAPMPVPGRPCRLTCGRPGPAWAGHGIDPPISPVDPVPQLVKTFDLLLQLVLIASNNMARVLLPCDVEEWWEDKRLFLLLSHMRTINDFDLLISSHTRKDQTVFAKRLIALQGLRSFLVNQCTAEEQNTFLTSTLPCIAKAASYLDERVPDTGIPFLSKQECKGMEN